MPEGSEGQPEGSEGLSEGLRACQRGLMVSQEDQGGNVWTDVRMDIWNFSPFHRTLSPVGAAAQKASLNQKVKTKRS